MGENLPPIPYAITFSGCRLVDVQEIAVVKPWLAGRLEGC
jgi:hypothetical protein